MIILKFDFCKKLQFQLPDGIFLIHNCIFWTFQTNFD